MATKKVTKASKRRLVMFGSLSLFMIVYFLVSLFSYIYRIDNLEKEKIKLENDLLTLKANEENLKIEIEKLKDPDYLARFARENYLYTKDGEYVIKIEPTNDEVKEVVEDSINEAYIIIPCIGVIAVIFIYIFSKGKKIKK